MNVFDLNKMVSFPYKEREKNVFFKAKEFKMRIIELPGGGKMPECDMESFVIFYVIEGSTDVHINQEIHTLKAGQCLVSEPARISMATQSGVKIMGVQVQKS